MKIKDSDKEYFLLLDEGEKRTLQDNQTKLYIIAQNVLQIVVVDKGIIKNTRQGIKKCDYLSKSDTHTHFIELKGAVIAEAYTQISETISHLNESEYAELAKNQNVFALIVSPTRNEVPRSINKYERNLSKKLANLCTKRVTQLNSLVKYVVVKPNLTKVIEKDNYIYISGKAPLRLA